MKLPEAIKKLSKKKAIAIAKKHAVENGIVWKNGICFVFEAMLKDPTRIPKIGADKDTEDLLICKWILKYKKGFDNRPSVRVSKPPKTIPDPLIEEIISLTLAHLEKKDLSKIKYAHRLGMSAENILGLLLEEYLAKNLEKYKWHCAWGATIKSVDFVNNDGRLLQVKNRSNSENSSSSKVRDGTTIRKWFRARSDKHEYMWDDINSICETKHLSEKAFKNFIKKVISDNPQVFAVETGNVWKKRI